MPANSNRKNKHKNEERTVRCPVEGCDKVVLARALHLHVGRKVGDGHGTSNEIPEGVDLDSAEEVGTEQVEMEYPEHREAEDVQRLCPYCERPYNGKQGVMIHLGALEGKKNHPKDAAERHELDDFPIVRVDENQNVIETLEEGTKLPVTEQNEDSNYDQEDVKNEIEQLREQGLDEQADRLEKMLFG